jgi:acyl carrier protein
MESPASGVREEVMSSVYDQLVSVLTSRFGVPAEEVGRDVTVADLDLDSLASVELADVLQEVLGVRVDEEQLRPELSLAQVAAELGEAEVARR